MNQQIPYYAQKSLGAHGICGPPRAGGVAHGSAGAPRGGGMADHESELSQQILGF